MEQNQKGKLESLYNKLNQYLALNWLQYFIVPSYFDFYCREKRKWKPPKSKSSKIELSDALGIHQQKGSKATSKLSHKKAKYDKNIGDDNTDMGLLNNDEELALQLLSR